MVAIAATQMANTIFDEFLLRRDEAPTNLVFENGVRKMLPAGNCLSLKPNGSLTCLSSLFLGDQNIFSLLAIYF
jgi:hypothetical protein